MKKRLRKKYRVPSFRYRLASVDRLAGVVTLVREGWHPRTFREERNDDARIKNAIFSAAEIVSQPPHFEYVEA